MKEVEIPAWITPETMLDACDQGDCLAFLDSSDRTNPYSRYSFLGIDPFLRLSCKGGRVILRWRDGREEYRSDLWDTLRELLLHFREDPSPPIDLPAGAAIGYLSYDFGMESEGVESTAAQGLDWPLAEFSFFEHLICFDHRKCKNFIISAGLRKGKEAAEGLSHILGRLEGLKPYGDGGSVSPSRFQGELVSSFDRVSYRKAIERIKGYISAGDVYQVNLSQCFAGKNIAKGMDLYRHMRRYNRVPFGSYLNFDGREILCFSMERFLNMIGREVETRPIKGTRPRGRDSKEDLLLSRELFESQKDRAELVMILDMERNDLGKVCRPGTVRVKRLFEVERYATVFHLVSTIKGELEEGADHLACMRACLPGGSITGAPKIRAMEIIDELEGIKRGVYCGAIGYFGFNQVSDFNIPIRTILKEGEDIRFNAGGGVLYDSDPDAEYEETLHKVRTFLDLLCPGRIDGG